MYRVEYHIEAEKSLGELDISVRTRIIKKIHWLSENIKIIIPEMLTGKYKGLYKLRVGDWRIIYHIDHINRIIAVYFIGHRREIYRI